MQSCNLIRLSICTMQNFKELHEKGKTWVRNIFWVLNSFQDQWTIIFKLLKNLLPQETALQLPTLQLIAEY